MHLYKDLPLWFMMKYHKIPIKFRIVTVNTFISIHSYYRLTPKASRIRR